jgi:poly(3-hydroxybutyrate) depolymerase
MTHRPRPALALILVTAFAAGCAGSAQPRPATRDAAGGTAGEGGTGGAAPAGGTGGGSIEPIAADAAPLAADVAPAPADASGDGPAPATAGRSAGCGTRNGGGMFMIPAGAGQQPYLVVLPSRYDGNKPYPLVFYLHGRGNDLADRPRNLETALAAADLAIVIYAKSITGGWEVPGRDRPEEHTTMLRAIKQHAFEQYCVDQGKVVMTGFSSGGNFIGYLQCTMASELAAAVIAGGSTHAECMGKLPSMVIVGRGDGTFAAAERSADYLRTRNGCMMARMPGAVAPCETYTGCPAGASTSFCPFAGGHMWPGFAASAVADLLRRL